MERAGVLEAICRQRRRLELVTTMYCPAHRGVSASAYADAVAKEYLQEEQSDTERGGVRKEYIDRREGREVMYEVQGEDGGAEWAVYDGRVYEAVKERAGWWVQNREMDRVRVGGDMGEVIIDRSKVGRAAVKGNGAYWEAVMRATGTAVRRKGETDAGGGEEEGEATATDRERARGGNRRWGVGASMRNGGEMPHMTQGQRWEGERSAEEARGERGPARRAGQQGCPACCGRKQGWGWVRAGEGEGSEWCRMAGEEVAKADSWHAS